MATSGTINSFMTARDIVTMALEEIGVLGAGAEANAADAAKALKHLSWMLKTWQTDQPNLWRKEDITITWPADTAEVTLDTNFLDITEARVVTDGAERILARWVDAEYLSLPNKTASGTPVIFNVGKTASTLSLRVWMVPSAETTIKAQGIRVIEDVTDLAQTLDLPQEWTETAYMVLAARLLNPFDTWSTNPNLAVKVEERAASLYQRLLAFDQQGSVFMAPWGR